MPEEYNGYANYETWCVQLWIDNDEHSHTYWNERARDAWEDALRTMPPDKQSFFARTQCLSVWLESTHTEDRPDIGCGGTVYVELLTHALGTVDWIEIADNILSALELKGYEPRP